VIDVGGLPETVVRDVAELELAAYSSVQIAATLRTEAVRCTNAALVEFGIRQWARYCELLGLSLGYMAAAARVEETA
jgi:hypothetical protein